MADWREELMAVLAGGEASVLLDEPLARHTSFHVGGPAAALVTVGGEEELVLVVEFCRRRDVEMVVLGRGTNVLVSDQGISGVVVKLGGRLTTFTITGDVVRAGGGASLDRLAEQAEKHGLVGLEFLAGIPGTVGGGLQTNAGAFGHSIAERIEEVVVMDETGGVRRLEKMEIRNEYRQAVIPQKLIVLEVAFKLKPGVPEKGVNEIRKERWLKHPDLPSAGSFFKNPKTEPAGKLIERCGLKGKTVGGAMVSEKHANFIVNKGGAQFGDVYELMQIVKATVEEETGIELEEEVHFLPGVKEVRLWQS